MCEFVVVCVTECVVERLGVWLFFQCVVKCVVECVGVWWKALPSDECLGLPVGASVVFLAS